ncbi:MAG: hypothetical protein GWP91_04015, partial [Rhodobacterales bacterium]|nr:hypothetical protein [Rhodobacterales bacterium]
RPVISGTGRRADQASFETKSFDAVADGITAEFTPFASRCSPMRVTEDGQILPKNNVSCNEVYIRKNGRVCHREGHIFFSASDRTNPLENGRNYVLTLDPERRCEGALWLYPGDEVLVPLALDGLDEFNKGARILRLNSRTMLGPKDDTGEVHIKLVVDGEQRLYAKVGVQKFQGAPWRFILNPLLTSSTENAHVVLSNPTDNFILVTSLALREYGPLNKQENKPNTSEQPPEDVEAP